ncbi:hypothetical protein HDU96_003080 [Phlyctochytrium bullatum]|nr:hypothetical protein HDU96_003080 [Phlyctochytrium bullatum]
MAMDEDESEEPQQSEIKGVPPGFCVECEGTRKSHSTTPLTTQAAPNQKPTNKPKGDKQAVEEESEAPDNGMNPNFELTGTEAAPVPQVGLDNRAGDCKTRRQVAQIQELCSIISGLLLATDYKEGQTLFREKNFQDNEAFFQDIYSQIYEVKDTLGFCCVGQIKTVHLLLSKKNGLRLLEDEYMVLATKEIISEGKSRAEIQKEIKLKEKAIEHLARKYGRGDNYDAVKSDIKAILSRPGWDDGSLGPVLVRLAWHASGTYNKYDGSGGSDGATMRFKPESTDGANAGLEHARAFLEPIKKKYSWISYADLWTLAGVTAIEAMGGPVIPWKPGTCFQREKLTRNPGRTDKDEKKVTVKDVPPNGRLPDASQGAQHIREVFYRMGFNDRDIVALSGAHTLGRCHADRSGYVGPWTNTPDRFSNQYFKLLTTVEWKKKKWDGPEQYADPDDELMMLPTDMALIWDPLFKPIVEEYAKDKEVFFKDFAAAFGKLLDLGVKRSGAKL